MQGNVLILVGIMFIFTGGIIAALAVPLINRSVKMNALYGVRIPKAFESEEAWYAINEYGGRILLKSGFVWIASGVVALVLVFIAPQEVVSSSITLPAIIAVPTILTLAGLIPIIRFAKKV
jgi:uncharacterized membrane protein